MFSRLWLILGLAFWLPASVARAEVTVFAAASLRGALDQVNAAYWAAQNNATDVTVSYASSAALARQIQQGAPADIFISANQEWMQVLVDDALTVAGSQVILLRNRLALIADPQEDVFPISALAERLQDGNLAMGFVNAVPAGIYGKRALQKLDLWQDVQPYVVQTDNVRAALALVALQEARYGIVYASDAEAAPNVAVLHIFSESHAGPINYPAVALRKTPNVLEYLDFLQSVRAQKIFAQHGFITGAGQ
ncbi:molybdate ABC transporter substrate-binding protein [Cognatishimia sp. WU-CL00825]|uniref:molybdate ABC transporter substrate-binding protein n=1 Tax=Cognatishimia sp. WU-CL00825 TaxID=3127658 RepID=UPI003104BDB8